MVPNRVEIEDAVDDFEGLIASLRECSPVMIVRGDEPLAVLASASSATGDATRKFGAGRGAITIVAEDDGHLADFGDYSP